MEPKNVVERRVWQFYTICDRNQLLKTKNEKVTVILVLRSWDARGLCGNSDPQKRFKYGRVTP
jgi:hypothetical protein